MARMRPRRRIGCNGNNILSLSLSVVGFASKISLRVIKFVSAPQFHPCWPITWNERRSFRVRGRGREKAERLDRGMKIETEEAECERCILNLLHFLYLFLFFLFHLLANSCANYSLTNYN